MPHYILLKNILPHTWDWVKEPFLRLVNAAVQERAGAFAEVMQCYEKLSADYGHEGEHIASVCLCTDLRALVDSNSEFKSVVLPSVIHYVDRYAKNRSLSGLASLVVVTYIADCERVSEKALESVDWTKLTGEPITSLFELRLCATRTVWSKMFKVSSEQMFDHATKGDPLSTGPSAPSPP